MAIGDYILCCKCEVKLLYDGDRGNRDWWEKRFGTEPEIMCPDCKTKREWVGLTDEEIEKIYRAVDGNEFPLDFYAEIEAKLKELNNG